MDLEKKFGAVVTPCRQLRTHTVAKRLGLSLRTIRHLAKTHKLRAQKTGMKLWAFDPADVEEFAIRRSRNAEIAN